MNIDSVASDHARIVQRLSSAEAGSVNQNVYRTLSAILSDNAVFANLADAFRYKLNIGPLDGRIKVAGDQYALAAELVVGGETRAQFGVRHLRGKMIERHFQSAPSQGRQFSQKCPDANFIYPEERSAEEPSQSWYAAETVLPSLGNGKVFLGDDPGRRALEYGKLRHSGRDLRHKLYCAGAGADHGHALAFQRYA